ncbi:disintegrin and metalloproteinase domain-containing protein 19-like [Clavelina lepadiformis]|uniref:disintegrin and metalloproteinase domain-containing protein 19-like n=1 Tax=Clavelina lepadiformis TaxID=159417 RepID=UPI0040429E2A
MTESIQLVCFSVIACIFLRLSVPVVGDQEFEEIFNERNLGSLPNFELVEIEQKINDKWSSNLKTQNQPGLHKHQVTFHASEKYVFRDLQLNVDVVDKHFCVTDPNSGQVLFPKPEDLNFRQYTGYAIHGNNDVSKAIVRTEPFRADIFMDGDIAVIRPVLYDNGTLGHVLFKLSALKIPEGVCGTDLLTNITGNEKLNFGINTDFDGMESVRRNKRDISSQTRYIHLQFVFAQNFNFLPDASVLNAVFYFANYMDTLFQPLGIRTVVSNVENWRSGDQIFVNEEDLYQTFVDMTRYRSIRVAVDPPTSPWVKSDHAIYLRQGGLGLFREENVTNIVGIAHIAAMCQPESITYSSIYALNNSLGFTPQVLTHEVGHSLGLRHDDNDPNQPQPGPCLCEEGDRDCIMFARLRSDRPFPTEWSNCSIKQLKIELELSTGHCLLDKPEIASLIPRSSCGNKIVEVGEECDCGTVLECTSRCCNPAACLLWDFAECDSEACCLSHQCKVAPPGTQCRESCGDCDLPEYCNGQNKSCPANRLVEDGGLCNNGTNRCSGGICISRDRMCQLSYGPDSSYAHSCDVFNTLGIGPGNCGLNFTSTTSPYIACTLNNIECGKFYCVIPSFVRGPIDRDLFYLTPATNETCVVQVRNPDIGFIDTTYVSQWMGCADNSKICNDNGNCHCFDGFAPPDCFSPGGGGSVDSGPPP